MLLTFGGCKKALEESPKNIIDPKSFFTNANSYEQAVLGIYSTLPGLYGGNTMMMREMFSDICGAPSSSFEQALTTYQNQHSSSFYCVRTEWSNDYTIIKNANFILGYLPLATLINEQKKTELTAEARFLRAFAYFQLVQFYGGVPIRTKALEDYNNLQLPRSSEEEVYKLILDDLTFAETNLPTDAAQQGRVYKMVATALLAKVYLTMAGNPLKKTNYYKDAKEKALAVIASPKFVLLDDYSKVFRNTAYTTESIWEQTYAPGTGNGLHTFSLTQKGFATLLAPSTWFINIFPAGDKRKEWGIQQAYADNVNNVTLPPFFAKFVNLDFINDKTKGPSNSGTAYTIPFLRIAEMYLIAAEAENEMNGPAGAYQYVNKIRWRARIDKTNPAHVPDLAGLSKEQLRTEILMERKRELYLEGSTWFDLKRTNTLSNIQTVRTPAVPIGAYNNTWLIPDNELNINKIPQNPAYQ